MNVNSVSSINSYPARTAEVKENKSNKRNDISLEKEIKDKYIPTQQPQIKISYEKPINKTDKTTIQKLMEESERTYSQLRELVRQLLEKQGMSFQKAEGLKIEIEIDEETRLEALEMISEGGSLSPENVSSRIVDFAKAISGGDKDKADMLIAAIEEGFKEASRIFGGELPEICKTTYDLVMEKINAWIQE